LISRWHQFLAVLGARSSFEGDGVITLSRLAVVGRTPVTMPSKSDSVERPPRQSTRSDVLRVVLGEDGLIAREGIASVIHGMDGIELVAAAGNLDGLREAIARTDAQVLLTDIRMPPDYTDEGIRFAAELRSTHPQVAVVVLSQHAEPVYAAALFARGSYRRAYLLKEGLKDPSELERAIREVARGGALVDPSIVEKMLWSRYSPAGRRLGALTSREREILALIAAAHTNQAIAERVGITRRGVERHINAIFGKLELGDGGEVSPRVKAALLFLAGEGRLEGDEPG
jgi:DNA-binding NarL/FixJ family response regulator